MCFESTLLRPPTSCQEKHRLVGTFWGHFHPPRRCKPQKRLPGHTDLRPRSDCWPESLRFGVGWSWGPRVAIPGTGTQALSSSVARTEARLLDEDLQRNITRAALRLGRSRDASGAQVQQRTCEGSGFGDAMHLPTCSWKWSPRDPLPPYLRFGTTGPDPGAESSMVEHIIVPEVRYDWTPAGE